MIAVVLDRCPHCHLATGRTKRGKACKSCNGSGGFRAEPSSNARHGGGRWSASARIAREKSAMAVRLRDTLKATGLRRVELPATVRFVRVAPAYLDDDNLRGSFKAIRDGLADALGLKSDRVPEVRWRYGQAKAGRGIYRVEVQIWQGQADCPCCAQPIIPNEDT